MKKLILTMGFALLTIKAHAYIHIDVVNLEEDKIERSYLKITDNDEPQTTVYLFPNRMIFAHTDAHAVKPTIPTPDNPQRIDLSLYHFNFQTHDCLTNKTVPTTIRAFRLTGIENLGSLKVIMDKQMLITLLAHSEQSSFFVTKPPVPESFQSISPSAIDAFMLSYLDRVNE